MAETQHQSNPESFDLSRFPTPVADALSGMLTTFAETLNEIATEGNVTADLRKRHLLADSVVRAYDAIVRGSMILSVPRELIETVNVSNRIVSFILDGNTHFATGILVGDCYVLTAAHLFFEDDGSLIDPDRASQITVEVHTTYLGNIITEGPRRTAKLYSPRTFDWLVDPTVKTEQSKDRKGQESKQVATRDVRKLDFAIVRLDHSLDEDIGFGLRRHWVEIPTAATAEILSTNLGVRVFQFLDRKELLTSSGYVRDVTMNGYRVLHTASTADSASGAFIGNDEFKLVAIHLGGSASGELPKSNRGLPIRRVAEEIDRVRDNGTTVRSELEKPCPG